MDMSYPRSIQTASQTQQIWGTPARGQAPWIVTGAFEAAGQIGMEITPAGWPATLITNLVTVSLLAAVLAVYQIFASLLSVIQLPPTVVVPFRSYASIARQWIPRGTSRTRSGRRAQDVKLTVCFAGPFHQAAADAEAPR
jgi:hypothetical protein